MTTASGRRLNGQVLVPGSAEGQALVLTAPLSFWGGLDARDGRIIDTHHPQCGAGLAGRVVVVSGTRGSSTSPSVLAEVVRAGRGPVALLLVESDLMALAGIAVANELYGTSVPVVKLDAGDHASIPGGALVRVEESGGVIVSGV